MDNEIVIKIQDKILKFKLKSQSIVSLEKIYEKNIFEIFQMLSFTNLQTILYECLINKDELNLSKDEMMDLLLTKYTLSEIPDKLLTEIAVVSGLIKKEEMTEDEIKNV